MNRQNTHINGKSGYRCSQYDRIQSRARQEYLKRQEQLKKWNKSLL